MLETRDGEGRSGATGGGGAERGLFRPSREHATSDDTDSGATKEDLAPLRLDERLLVARTRAGIAIVLFSITTFTVADLLFVREGLTALLLVKLVQLVILGSAAVLLRRQERAPRPRLLAALAVSAVYLTTATSAVLRHDYFTSCFLFVTLAMGTATFLPWGARAQLATVAVGAFALLANAAMVHAEGASGLLFPAIAVLVAFTASVWIAREHERHRVERFLVERQLESSRRRLEEESSLSGALAHIGLEMISSVNAPQILGRLCELTTELLRCDACVASLRDESDDCFAARAFHGYSPDDWEAIRVLRIPASIVSRVVAELGGEPIQMRTREIPNPAVAAMHRQYGVRTAIHLPLRRGSEVIGILSAHQRSHDEPFTPLQRRLAQGIAHLGSLALANARLVDELRQANQLKSEFVSTMSHELRTPVSVILGYTEMIADAESSEERTALLTRVRRSALELHDLIEETLNLNRLEAGKDPPRVERVELRELFDELVGEFAAVASLDDVAVRWEGPRSLEIHSDRRKLRIVLKNLLGNALKFTPDGEIVVRAGRLDGEAVISVSDTGVGIAPEHLPIIFDMFRQADSSDARSYRGAGLGLYIVRRLTAQLGGDVEVESEPGRGSRFTITLPQTDELAPWPREAEDGES